MNRAHRILALVATLSCCAGVARVEDNLRKDGSHPPPVSTTSPATPPTPLVDLTALHRRLQPRLEGCAFEGRDSERADGIRHNVSGLLSTQLEGMRPRTFPAGTPKTFTFQEGNSSEVLGWLENGFWNGIGNLHRERTTLVETLSKFAKDHLRGDVPPEQVVSRAQAKLKGIADGFGNSHAVKGLVSPLNKRLALAQKTEDEKRDRIKDLVVELSDGRVLTDVDREAKAAQLRNLEAELEDLGHQQRKLGGIFDAVNQALNPTSKKSGETSSHTLRKMGQALASEAARESKRLADRLSQRIVSKNHRGGGLPSLTEPDPVLFHKGEYQLREAVLQNGAGTTTLTPEATDRLRSDLVVAQQWEETGRDLVRLAELAEQFLGGDAGSEYARLHRAIEALPISQARRLLNLPTEKYQTRVSATNDIRSALTSLLLAKHTVSQMLPAEPDKRLVVVFVQDEGGNWKARNAFVAEFVSRYGPRAPGPLYVFVPPSEAGFRDDREDSILRRYVQSLPPLSSEESVPRSAALIPAMRCPELTDRPAFQANDGNPLDDTVGRIFESISRTLRPTPSP